MPSSTTSYDFNLPTVGGDVDLWGGYLNSNWEDLDDLLDGTAAIDGIDIDSGSIDGTPIGANDASTGAFTSVSVTSGSSGASANASADELFVENDADAGISILTPNTNNGRIYFGDSDDNAVGRIQYSHGTDSMIFFTDGTQAVRINSVGSVGIKSSGGPTSKLDVAGTISSTEESAGANCAFRAGLGRSATGTSNLDLIGDTTYTDYGLRIIRGPNANAVSNIQHRGTGALTLTAEDAGSIVLNTNGSDRVQISADGIINFSGLPTSSAGLSSGDLWNDSGTLKIA
jgi:hypothetical protein